MNSTKAVFNNPDLIHHIHSYLSLDPETVEYYIKNGAVNNVIEQNDECLSELQKVLKNNKIKSNDVEKIIIESLNRKIWIITNKRGIVYKFDSLLYSAFIKYICDYFYNIKEIFILNSDKAFTPKIITFLKVLLKPKKYFKIKVIVQNGDEIVFI